MNITHCISSIDESIGGPARSATHLVEKLACNQKISKVFLLALESRNPVDFNTENKKIHLSFYKNDLSGFSYGLKKELLTLETDIYHGHSLWELPIHLMSVIARKRHKPYIISPRGTLLPWSINQKKNKKQIAMLLYQRKDLAKADCLHATSIEELKSIRFFGFKNPIALIPNGIDVDKYPQKKSGLKDDTRKIIFLSRIHYKKGIEILIQAFNDLETPLKNRWTVEVVGDGDKGYIKELNHLIKSMNLQDKIILTGSKYDESKIEAYQDADLFVLPTHSENFGNVIAEALCCGTPAITTTGTPWEELNQFDCGKWIDLSHQNLTQAMSELMNKTDEERTLMGLRGRKLIIDNYSIDSIAEKMTTLYEWLLKGGKTPDFVDVI